MSHTITKDSNISVSFSNQRFGVVQGKVSKIRNGHTSPIKYQELEILSQYADLIGDNTWKDFFASASRGNIPKPLKYETMCFYYKKKKDFCRFHLVFKNTPGINSIDSIKEVFESCKDFVSSVSGVSSNTDDVDIFSIIKPTVDVFKWTGNIPIFQQITFVSVYAAKKAVEFNLTEIQKNDLIINIIAMITSKSIESKSVFLNNYEITSITGLSFFPGGYQFDVPMKVSKRSNTDTRPELKVLPSSKEISYIIKRRNYPEFLANCYDIN